MNGRYQKFVPVPKAIIFNSYTLIYCAAVTARAITSGSTVQMDIPYYAFPQLLLLGGVLFMLAWN